MSRSDDVPRDILEDIRSGRVTPEQASQIFEALIDAVHAGDRDPAWWTVLGMTMEEASVVAHGRPWVEAVSIREGATLAAATSGDLGADYAEAAEAWTASEDAAAWATTIDDGLEASDRRRD